MDLITTRCIKTPAGELLLGSYRERLCLCDWRWRKMRGAVDGRIQRGLEAEYAEGDSAVLCETEKQLGQYFSGERREFDLDLLPVGTDFQKRVWEELLRLGYGQVSTYGELAVNLGSPRAVRAVASANGANAISIIIPCHRIVGADGSPVGYAGGISAKKRLLSLESAGAHQLQMSFMEERK